MTLETQPGQSAGEGSFVFDATAENFQSDVLERSREVPVVVDFWADWCGPCKTLAPILDKLATEFRGKFLLAKVNTDSEQQVAAAFGVQSLPTVVALVDGQPIDAFQGARSETEVRDWLQQILPSEAAMLLEEATVLETTDPAAAEEKYQKALQFEPEHAAASIGLARVLLAQDKTQAVREVLERLEARGYLEPEAEQIKNALEVKSAARDTGGIDAARAAAEADPTNLDKQIELAESLAAAGDYEEACELCIARFGETKNEAVKETLVKILDLVGSGTELAGRYRKQLARLMY